MAAKLAPVDNEWQLSRQSQLQSFKCLCVNVPKHSLGGQRPLKDANNVDSCWWFCLLLIGHLKYGAMKYQTR